MASITCPQCHMTSGNSGDIENKYCGNCHQYHDDMVSLNDLPADPVQLIEARMEQMSWSQADLSRLTGFTRVRISEYLNRKRKLPLSFIRAYSRVDTKTPLALLIKDYELYER